MSDRRTDSNEEYSPEDMEEQPGGWLFLTQTESIQYIIEALLDSTHYREFTRTELADRAGITRQTVSNHLDKLQLLGIIVPVEGSSPQRFRFNPEGAVSQKIIELDAAIKKKLDREQE